MNIIVEKIIYAGTLGSDEKAYDYLESVLIEGTKFNNRFKREFKFKSIRRLVGYPPRIEIYRQTGSYFEITFFKFKRNFVRKNWLVLNNEFRTYKKKKLII